MIKKFDTLANARGFSTTGRSLFGNKTINDFTQFVLFEGKNGSGKSTLLRGMANSQIISIGSHADVFLDINMIQVNQRQGFVSQESYHWKYANNLIQSTPELSNILEILSKLFKRTVTLSTKNPLHPILTYKKNEMDIEFISDGLGIYSVLSLLLFVSFSPKDSILFIEDISVGLYPSLVITFLEEFFKIAKSRNIQIFSTTQDPFVIFYFLKNKLEIVDDRPEWKDNNPDYSVFNFTDNEYLEVTKVSAINYEETISDLMPQSFMGGSDYMKFSSLFLTIKK